MPKIITIIYKNVNKYGTTYYLYQKEQNFKPSTWGNVENSTLLIVENNSHIFLYLCPTRKKFTNEKDD